VCFGGLVGYDERNRWIIFEMEENMNNPLKILQGFVDYISIK